MATARVAAGSVMDTVTATANTVSTAVNVIGDGIQMLGNFVAKHRTMQSMSIKVELRDYKTRLIEDSALETQKRRIEIDKFIAANPTYKSDYEKELVELRKLLDEDENTNLVELKAA